MESPWLDSPRNSACHGGIGAARARASHAPGYPDDSAAVFRLEKDRIFLKDWLCAARVKEVAAPGRQVFTSCDNQAAVSATGSKPTDPSHKGHRSTYRSVRSVLFSVTSILTDALCIMLPRLPLIRAVQGSMRLGLRAL